MGKNTKMSTVITARIALIVVLCLVFLSIMQSRDITETMRQVAIDQMTTALDAQTRLIEQYVDDSERLLKEYASAYEIKDLLKNQDDAEKQKIAEQYTLDFYANLSNWEGVYTSTWETTVLAHSSEGAIGMTTRPADQLEPYQATMLNSEDGFYNGSVFTSPASGKMILNMRMAVFADDGKTPIGLVGGGPFISGLGDILEGFSVAGLDTVKYSILDSANVVYVLDSNEENIAQPIEDENLLKILENVENGKEKGTIEYSDDGEKYILCYKSLPQYHLILTMRDTKEELFAASRATTTKLVVFCAIILAIILISVYVVSKLTTKPLVNVEMAVDNLSALSLAKDNDIQGYIGTRSEVGKMATSVDNLTNTWNNIINTLKSCTQTLNEGTETMSQTAEALVDCATDNMSTTKELSDSIASTNSSIQSVNEEVQKITELLGHVNRHLDDSTQKGDVLFDATNTMAENARKNLDFTGARIDQTKENIKEALESLNALSQINEMASRILDITNQTNLLSLNASIEAARAGEAGRGFAVVADEIGNLANDSSQTVGEIQRICQDTNTSIERIQRCFDEIIDFMENEVFKYYRDIVASSDNNSKDVTQLKEIIEGMGDEALEVMAAIENIRQQMENIFGVSNENGNSINNIIVKNEVTNQIAEQVNSLVKDQQSGAEQINDIISRFKY